MSLVCATLMSVPMLKVRVWVSFARPAEHLCGSDEVTELLYAGLSRRFVCMCVCVSGVVCLAVRWFMAAVLTLN